MLRKKVKVVIDCGNGTASLVAPKVFKSIGCDVSSLYCTPNPSFPHHLPDPSKVKNLKSLIRNVRLHHADVGIAFDGDGDRLGLVDAKGNIYGGDPLMVILSRDLLSRKKRARVVVEVKSSSALVEDIRNHKGIPIISKTGHSFIQAEMKKHSALLGGELSGHLFIKENYFGYDDAIFAAAKVLFIMSERDAELSDLLKGLPKYYTSNEIRVGCPEDKKFAIIEGLKKYFKGKYRVSLVDGVKIQFNDGWALVRASNTQPVIDLRFEARSKRSLRHIKRVVYARLR